MFIRAFTPQNDVVDFAIRRHTLFFIIRILPFSNLVLGSSLSRNKQRESRARGKGKKILGIELAFGRKRCGILSLVLL